MSVNLNGLTGGTPVYYDGSRPIWASKDSPEFTGNATFEEITVADGTGDNVNIYPTGLNITNNGNEASINVSSAGVMNIYGPLADGTLFYPNGSTLPAIQLQSLNSDVVTIQAADNGDQLVCSSIKGRNLITGTGTSGVGQDSSFSGLVNFVKVTTAGNLTIQFNGSACVPGTIWEYVLDPTSFAGATVSFNNLSTVLASFTPSTAAAGRAIQVRVFTPDGTTFYVLS